MSTGGLLLEALQAGGVLAFALFIGYELRAFRLGLSDHLRTLSEGVAILLDRDRASGE